jgi:hypothetical protein
MPDVAPRLMMPLAQILQKVELRRICPRTIRYSPEEDPMAHGLFGPVHLLVGLIVLVVAGGGVLVFLMLRK